MATSQKNPAWLDALLAQTYPGNATDMSAFPNVMQAHAGGTPTGPIIPRSGGYAPPGGDPRAADSAMNMNTGMAPGSLGNIPIPVGGVRHPYAPPVPNPSNVGGAPSPGIPAPQGANRTANNPPMNPNFGTVQYQTPNSVGGRAPIYTAANLGSMFGGSPQQTPTGHPSATPPAGALSGGFDVGKMFQNLPNNTFDGSTDTSGVAPWNMGLYQQKVMGSGQQTGPNRPSSGVDPSLWGY
jgi:hypothetical protein